MVKFFLIILLALSVVCMLWLSGLEQTATGHPHHGNPHHGMSASCATCMGPNSFVGSILFLTLMGLARGMILPPSPLSPIRDQFHPPRAR